MLLCFLSGSHTPVPLDIFKVMNDSVKEQGIDCNLKSYITFIEIYKKTIKASLQTYEDLLQKIGQILARVTTHFEASASQVVSLEKMKEKSKAAVVDHQNFTVNLQVVPLISSYYAPF